VDGFDLEQLVQRVGSGATISGAASAESALEALETTTSPRFALLGHDRNYIVDPTIDPDAPISERLDVNICHRLILEEGLGMTADDIADQRFIRYIKGSGDIQAELDKSDTQLVVAMRAPTIKEVVDVSEAGGVMPQKSTFFWPKLASGLLLNLFSLPALNDNVL
jgi:uncharacterized protein (DUF1015 family)